MPDYKSFVSFLDVQVIAALPSLCLDACQTTCWANQTDRLLVVFTTCVISKGNQTARTRGRLLGLGVSASLLWMLSKYYRAVNEKKTKVKVQGSLETSYTCYTRQNNTFVPDAPYVSERATFSLISRSRPFMLSVWISQPIHSLL